jgi:hypothetical protein
MRRTSISSFTSDWDSTLTAITDTFEAAAVYKCLSDVMYYLIVEDLNDNRYYELHTASSLNGLWTKVAEQWASRNNLVYNADHWTDYVSQGEAIRVGVNQKLEINDIDRPDFLIQGLPDGSYTSMPWDLGFIRNYSGQTTPGPTAEPTVTPIAEPTTTPQSTSPPSTGH